MNALALAFGLLTTLPVRRPELDRRTAGRAILLAPVTTLPMLAVLWLAHASGGPSLLLGVLVLVVEALVTRALHLDGLADTADGLSAGPDRARRLRAMKASDTGPSGVVALVLTLLLQAEALHLLLPTRTGTLLAMAAWLTSRHVLAWACHSRVPSVSSGLGAAVAGTVGTLSLGAVLVVVAALTLAAGSQGPVVVVVGVAGGLVVVGTCVKVLGGITGDVLGACVEVGLTAGLVAGALVA